MVQSSRILIVRLGAMGDIIHALPLLASLRRQWPDAHIDWLVEARHSSLLDLVRGLNTSVVIDTRMVGSTRGWVPIVRTLRRQRYDLVIDAQGLIKSAVLARSTGSARVVGFDRRSLREPAAVMLYTERVDPGPASHVVEKNLAIARHVGAEPLFEFDVDVPRPGVQVSSVLQDMGDHFVVLNPGAAWPNKRWPAERFAGLAARILATEGRRSLVLWGPGERELAAAVVAGAPDAARVAPETTLGDLVAILARATLLVSGDTGPLHIAAALGTPVVGIFGPTNPQRNGPWAADDVSVSRSGVCRCFHARRCHASRWCLDDLTVEEVAAAVTGRLAGARRVKVGR